MSVEVAGRNTPFGRAFQADLRNVFAGAICSVLSTAYCLSYAALIFAGPLKQWLSYGVAITFLSAAVAAAVVALRSSLPFAIAGPDTSTSAVTATLVAVMVQNLVDHGITSLLGPTMIVLALSAAVDRHAALRARLHARGTRHPFRAVSGDRRIPRRHRLADDPRRDPGGDRPTDDAGRHSRLFMSGPIAGQARGRHWRSRWCCELLLPLSHNPFMMPGILIAAIAGHACRRAADRGLAGRGAGRRLDIPAATRDRAVVAVDAGTRSALSHGRCCLRSPAICSRSCS